MLDYSLDDVWIFTFSQKKSKVKEWREVGGQPGESASRGKEWLCVHHC